MEISVILAEFKAEANELYKKIRAYEEEEEKIRERIAFIQKERRPMSDRYDALKMNIESLELLASLDTSVAIPDQEQKSVPVTEKKQKVAKVSFSRMPKKIGKYDPKGKKLGEFPSINKAASAFGWSNSSMRKYIDCTSKEKQIRLRGFYLEFVA